MTSRGTEPHSTGETVPRAVQPLSYAGSALTTVALPVLVFGSTGSAFLTGLVARSHR
jgi:hypothetical protein